MGRGGNEVSPPELEELTVAKNRRKPTVEKVKAKEIKDQSSISINNNRETEIKYPEYIGSTLASILVFIMGATMRGLWIDKLHFLETFFSSQWSSPPEDYFLCFLGPAAVRRGWFGSAAPASTRNFS